MNQSNLNQLFSNLKVFLIGFLVFLFPVFFLPTTQEFFLTNKLYLLSFGLLFVFLLSLVSYLLSRKLSWQSRIFDTTIFLFLITTILSIVISSPNKIQAFLNPNSGLLAFLSLALLYFYLSRSLSLSFIHYSLTISGFVISLITIVFFFQPLKNANLPFYLQVIKNPFFTPLGSQIDLAIFLGFFLVYGLARTLKDRKIQLKNSSLNFSFLILNLIALFLTLYNLFKPTSTNTNFLQPIFATLTPFRLSWYAAVEILKQPLTALFGVGIDNFSTVFTRVKDLNYNQSPQWQIPSFNYSRSTLLHVFTENGLFGLIAFSLLIWQLIKSSLNNDIPQKIVIYYLLFVLLFFPPSLISWFLFFVVLGVIAQQKETSELNKTTSVDLFNLGPIYLGSVIISLVLILGTGYLLGRSYLAEYYFKKSLDGVIKNNAKEVYDNNRQAIISNPYIERFRVNFSQVNLIIANNIAQKVNQNQNKEEQKNQLSENDRQNISQAIQAAIAEAKAAITLNPQKAEYWQNLANIYQQTINLAQGADLWTISAYQRAIILDPQNPIYRLNLGGIYYSLGNFEEAGKVFEQTVFLKPDWANAHYNLAWADYQRGNFQRAVSEMENVLSLLNPKNNKADYDKAKKELEEFKKKLPQEEQKATESAGQSSQLNLPTPIPTIQPKIELPKEASPEAQ